MAATQSTGIVWVTGAGQGIGRAVAWEYARHGWHVAVSARTAANLESLTAAASQAGLPGKIFPFVLDVTDHDAVKQVFKAVEAEVGCLNHVIFNAGTHIPNEIADFGVDAFRALMEINFMGAVHGLSAVIPSFVQRRQGRIGVVASVAGYRGLPRASAYGASKAALINMCEALRAELDAMGVTLSVINPGFVRTPLTDKNSFPMPFLMEADDAARRVFEGMAGTAFEIAFPRPFVTILRFLRMLPYGLYFPLIKKVTRV